VTVSGEADQYILKSLPIVERLSVERIFAKGQPLEVEIGAGDGSFLVAYAKAHPEINLIGLERLLGRLRKIDRKARRAGLENVRLLRLEAAYFVQYMLPRESVRAFHIYFPDPWPKRRHWKNRLINDVFVPLLRDALGADGRVHLRTDDLPYFAQITDVFARSAHFKKVETDPELLQIITDFERGFQQRGVSTNHVSYQRVS
jgi:tRNA (guanine-N7-)-methyltransferase